LNGLIRRTKRATGYRLLTTGNRLLTTGYRLLTTGNRLPAAAGRGYHGGMNERDGYLAADDAELLGQCEVHTYKSSGPGGQHRNKVSSAIRLHHRPTGITALANESRSQRDNKLQAIRRLRMNIALQLRCPADLADFRPTEVISECLFVARGGPAAGGRIAGSGRSRRCCWICSKVRQAGWRPRRRRLG
jgi:hypothetical protein